MESQVVISNRIETSEVNAESGQTDSVELRKGNSLLRSQIANLSKRLSSVESGHTSSDVTVSGLPLSKDNTPSVMVQRVFRALGIPELKRDILKVRVLAGKTSGVIGERQNMSTTNTMSRSLVVVLKSPRVQDFIMAKNREHEE